MSALDDITDFAQNVYYTVNGSESTASGTSLVKFQNNFIRAFNLWLDEYETEAYWNKLRDDNYELATISDTTNYVFELDSDYRTPVINQYQYVKILDSDGNKLSSFKLVDPNQRYNDDPDAEDHPNRATFVNDSIVLSRAPIEAEVGGTLVLDLVKYHPRLTTTDASGLDYLPSKQLAVFGLAKNTTLADVTKVALSPSFAQKYKNELDKQVAANNASNEAYDSGRDSYGYITGVW